MSHPFVTMAFKLIVRAGPIFAQIFERYIPSNLDTPHRRLRSHSGTYTRRLPLEKFCALQCIKFRTDTSCYINAAIDDSLRLPTLQEVHMSGRKFLLRILSNHSNITRLSLVNYVSWGLKAVRDGPEFPHLKSIIFLLPGVAFYLIKWGKRCLVKLQSLSYD